MNILVTDGENRSALAVTRSLGKRGCRVVVAGRSAKNLASTSKFCSKGLAVPDPLGDRGSYIDEIQRVVAEEEIHFIFPVTEQAIYQLNPVREELPGGMVLACPPADMMQAISDKSALCKLAERLNVPIPHSWHLSSAADLPEVIGEISEYPVVVKPALSKIREGDRIVSAGVRYATSREDLERLYANNPVLQYPSMIQEKITGPGTGLFTLYDKDRHLALFSHRRLREKPPSGGVSVLSESVPLDPEMVEAADRLLSAVGWQGVAMVEFKRDLRDGKPKLMEINGRFWGSLQLAIACGVDFPSLLLDYLQGEKAISPENVYLVGHKMKWLFGTLDHLLIRLKNSDEKLNLSPGFPSKWQALAESLKIWERNTSFDVLDRKDMRPFWFEALAYGRQALGRKG